MTNFKYHRIYGIDNSDDLLIISYYRLLDFALFQTLKATLNKKITRQNKVGINKWNNLRTRSEFCVWMSLKSTGYCL